MSQKKFKHLVVLIDGTWISAADGRFRDSTNIFRLNHAIDTADENGNPQITFYMPGPGTRGWTDKPLVGGWLGTGLDEIIKETYVNLASNYNEADDTQQADRIYLFGFSRGAVAAQAVSGLISRCGLLYGRSIDQFRRVWTHFLHPKRDTRFQEEMPEFANDDVKIEMLGAFDAVLGRPYWKNNPVNELKFEDYKLDSLVKFGLQILAADDNRKRFSPFVWEGIHGEMDSQTERIKQIWMPGVHADVGGIPRGDHTGNFLSDVALLTMMEQVQKHTELSIDDEYVSDLRESLKRTGRIDISDERQPAYMKIDRYAERKTCREKFGDAVHVGEQIHPVYDFLHGKKIRVRGRKREYSNACIDSQKNSLPRYETELKDMYAEECARIITQMR